MALWQFDCYIIPRGNYVAENKIVADDILSWKNKDVPLIQIDFLEKQPSWTESIVQYGKVDEACIQFFYEGGLLEEINCRFDLRSLSKIMLKNILVFVQEIEGMIFCEDKIYCPNVVEMVELMKKSNASKFCKNPIGYFDKLSNS